MQTSGTPYFLPFVYIVDSPSSTDLIDGYTIGMALRDVLRASRINVFYALATDQVTFENVLSTRLQQCTQQLQALYPNIHYYPFLHLCMHGDVNGIILTKGDFYGWDKLKCTLKNHNNIQGYNPKICMASCNGIQGINMVDANNSVFDFLIGNEGSVGQADLTVAFLTFYHNIFYKGTNISDAVEKMKVASGDNHFYFAIGDQIKQQKFQQSFFSNYFSGFPSNT